MREYQSDLHRLTTPEAKAMIRRSAGRWLRTPVAPSARPLPWPGKRFRVLTQVISRTGHVTSLSPVNGLHRRPDAEIEGVLPPSRLRPASATMRACTITSSTAGDERAVLMGDAGAPDRGGRGPGCGRGNAAAGRLGRLSCGLAKFLALRHRESAPNPAKRAGDGDADGSALTLCGVGIHPSSTAGERRRAPASPQSPDIAMRPSRRASIRCASAWQAASSAAIRAASRS